jgi:hypothetical protein
LGSEEGGMKKGHYMDVEMIPVGIDDEGTITSDDDLWLDGQTDWNIYVTEREEDGEYYTEVMDLDIPVDLEDLAGEICALVCRKVEMCNELGVPLS